MLQPKVAIVSVASVYEQGFEETERWMDIAVRSLQQQGLGVVSIKPVLFTDRAMSSQYLTN